MSVVIKKHKTEKSFKTVAWLLHIYSLVEDLNMNTGQAAVKSVSAVNLQLFVDSSVEFHSQLNSTEFENLS